MHFYAYLNNNTPPQSTWNSSALSKYLIRQMKSRGKKTIADNITFSIWYLCFKMLRQVRLLFTVDGFFRPAVTINQRNFRRFWTFSPVYAQINLTAPIFCNIVYGAMTFTKRNIFRFSPHNLLKAIKKHIFPHFYCLPLGSNEQEKR